MILSACGGSPIQGKTRLVKLVYVASHELMKAHKKVPIYEFHRYYYGPFSQEIVNDLETLQSEKLISHKIVQHGETCGYEENVYRITEKGTTEIEKKRTLSNLDIFEIVEKIKNQYNDIPLSMLVHEVYSKYPLPAR
jgi:uncharacterized protein YwgA